MLMAFRLSDSHERCGRPLAEPEDQGQRGGAEREPRAGTIIAEATNERVSAESAYEQTVRRPSESARVSRRAVSIARRPEASNP
jgi:hypothetical protein